MASTDGVWRMLHPGATNYAWRFYRAGQMP
jgi:hypothetical protein